jgi:quercetin dioxygenase-like cupin family protein
METTQLPTAVEERSKAMVVGPGAGRRHSAPSADVPLPAIEIKLDGHAGAPFAVMEYEVPPQFAPPPVLHRHTREFGAVYVLDGELVYWFEDGQAHPARPGTLVVMGNDWFRWANLRSEPARILCIFAPAGFEQFFADIHESMRELDYDMTQFGSVLVEHRRAYGDEAHG